MSIEFWFEFGSSYSYPAAMRIERIAQQERVAVQWRSFLLGPIFSKQGWNTSPFNIYETKGRYMWRDIERICDAMNIAFRKPTVFPRNSLLAARIACEFAQAAWIGEFVRRVYVANFGDDRDIADQAVLKQILSDLGAAPDSVVDQALTPASKARLRAQTDEAQRLGIFGAPSIRVGDELFWGNDRLEDAFRWHQRRGGQLTPV
jgi:2-hydroxychromene-2-carboxylate isomerase